MGYRKAGAYWYLTKLLSAQDKYPAENLFVPKLVVGIVGLASKVVSDKGKLFATELVNVHIIVDVSWLCEVRNQINDYSGYADLSKRAINAKITCFCSKVWGKEKLIGEAAMCFVIARRIQPIVMETAHAEERKRLKVDLAQDNKMK